MFFPWIPIAFADSSTPPTVVLLVYRVSYYILNPLIKIGFVFALVYFMWGVVEYLWKRDGGTIPKSGSHILWGLLGMFIMLSAFGIMALIKGILGSDIVTP